MSPLRFVIGLSSFGLIASALILNGMPNSGRTVASANQGLHLISLTTDTEPGEFNLFLDLDSNGDVAGADADGPGFSGHWSLSQVRSGQRIPIPFPVWLPNLYVTVKAADFDAKAGGAIEFTFPHDLMSRITAYINVQRDENGWFAEDHGERIHHIQMHGNFVRGTPVGISSVSTD